MCHKILHFLWRCIQNPSLDLVANRIKIRNPKDGFGNQNDNVYINIQNTKSESCSTTHCTILKWRDVLNERCNGLQIWAKLPSICDLNSMFQNYSSNESNLFKLLHFLYEEGCFDKFQMSLIQSKY